MSFIMIVHPWGNGTGDDGPETFESSTREGTIDLFAAWARRYPKPTTHDIEIKEIEQ